MDASRLPEPQLADPDQPAPEPTNPELMAAAVEGLMRPFGRKALSPKWFYDETGSALFERITELPEYYLGRAEREILAASLDRIAAHVPPGAELVELGSGASVKTRRLLDRLDALARWKAPHADAPEV
ncbi:L-histidine N(alpha)-methyltransferase, partial [uncultured Albimonas sp.]|uniref:L-histidine N(alpha)-methyltransferase n=1 Tax=uncultured Albimonas sp. TaxID=1331701 RepID=UPI0030EBB0EE